MLHNGNLFVIGDVATKGKTKKDIVKSNLKDMSSYLIFVLVLTAVYIIYYAVIITKDLYGKKDEAKSTEEVFDISSMADAEESIAVEENEGGFSVGSDSYNTVADAMATSNDNNLLSGESYNDVNEEYSTDKRNDSREQTDNTVSTFERMKARMEEQMEETESFMSDPMTDEELYAAMIMREPKLKWNLVKNEI